MEVSEEWTAGKRYSHMNMEMENKSESANSEQKRIHRKNVARFFNSLKRCIHGLVEEKLSRSKQVADNLTT